MALMLIEDYLNDRTQVVRIKDHKSSKLTLKTEVPQGTILGSLLFIVYINDFLTIMPKENIISYADDTVILSSGATRKQAEYKMNKFLSNVNLWMESNELSLNMKETVYMAFDIYSDSVPKN